MDITSLTVSAISMLLVVLLALVCAVIAKYLLASRPKKAKKQEELVYMLHVDKQGRMKIKRHRGNVNVVQQWGED